MVVQLLVRLLVPSTIHQWTMQYDWYMHKSCPFLVYHAMLKEIHS